MKWDIIDLGPKAPKRYKAVSSEVSSMPGQIVVMRDLPGERAAQLEDKLNIKNVKQRLRKERGSQS